VSQRNFSNEVDIQKYRLLEVVSECHYSNASTLFILYYKNNNDNDNDNIQIRNNDDDIKSTRTVGSKWADHYKMFLPSDDKLIRKALCNYEHTSIEPNSVGPIIIQIIDVANEWQNTGLGSALMRSMHKYFCDKFFLPLSFVNDEGFSENITLTIEDVEKARVWFIKRHRFKDGRGGDLVKPLMSDDYEHEHLFEKEASAYEEYEQKRSTELINCLQRIGELNRQDRLAN
jgi:hypothetical protein